MSLELLGVAPDGEGDAALAASLAAAQGTGAPSLDGVRAGRGVIKKGMRGDAVAYVQKIVEVTADGDFGDDTETAVKEFQSACGLDDSGVVDKPTMSMLDEAFKGTTYVINEKAADPVAAAPSPAPSNTSNFGLWLGLAALLAAALGISLSRSRQ